MYHDCTPEIARALLELPHVSGPDQKLLNEFIDGAFYPPAVEAQMMEHDRMNGHTNDTRTPYDHLSDLIQSRFQELAAKGVV